MKKSLLALAATAAAVISAPASAAIIVSMNPAAQSVAIGDMISVDVQISGLGSEILSSFDVNVLFNSALVNGPGLSFYGAQFGSVQDSYISASFDPGNTGAIGGSVLVDDDLAAVQTPGGFTFLTFSWTAAADGALFLDFGPDLDFDRNVVGRRFQSLDATFQGTCIAIGTGDCTTVPVPEPSSYALAGLALLGCGLATTRRRRQSGSATA